MPRLGCLDLRQGESFLMAILMMFASTNPLFLLPKSNNSTPKDLENIRLLKIISNNENMRKGFTLIELLVVIAIIGLLASIVTVSLSSSQDRAKQAKIESFAAQVHHALAADAVGIWDFDDAAAGTANDTSGLKNNGVFPGGFNKPTSSTDRYEQAGKAYSFDGGDYITAGSGTTIDNLITSSWTVSGWIKRNELGVSHTLAGMGDSYGAEQDRGFFLYVDRK